MLFIVATPIGNLGDITLRAIETLKQVDVIFCEDTRQTRKLVDHFGLQRNLVSLHQHSSEEKIIQLLERYENIAYVSDAGTPGISDPGGKVVKQALELGHDVVPIPGVSAVVTALSVSGFPVDKFVFLGFMPHKGRNKFFKSIKESEQTVCFYESPHRIEKTIVQLKEELDPERQIVIARELTKKFETIYRGTISEIADEVKIKGEFTIVIAGKK